MFKFYYLSLVILSYACLMSSCKQESSSPKERSLYHFYVGTYTQKEGHVDGKGEGVYKIAIDMTNDSMTIEQTISDFVNPSFLALSNDQNHIYVVNELGPNENNYNARLSHISIDSTGKHRKAQESGTYGNAACHVALNPSSNMVVVSNYLGGELAFGKLGRNGNVIGEVFHHFYNCKSANAARQEASHLHMAAFTNDGNTLITADLGCDSLRIYEVDTAKVTLTQKFAIGTKAGDGPRHFAIDKNDKIVYVTNELTNTISSYQLDKTNRKLSLMKTASTLPGGFTGVNSTAHVAISPDGKNLYVSNRGHETLAHFALDGNGSMTHTGYIPTEGKTPRHFTITEDGKYLLIANQDSNSIVVYALGADGKATKKSMHSIKTPVCLVESKK